MKKSYLFALLLAASAATSAQTVPNRYVPQPSGHPIERSMPPMPTPPPTPWVRGGPTSSNSAIVVGGVPLPNGGDVTGYFHSAPGKNSSGGATVTLPHDVGGSGKK